MTQRDQLAAALVMLRAAVQALEAAQEAAGVAQEATQAPEGLISTAESARRSGMRQATILAWIARGTLPATKPQGSRGYRVRPSDLAAVLAGKGGAERTGTEPHPAPVDLAGERGRRLGEALRGTNGGR